MQVEGGRDHRGERDDRSCAYGGVNTAKAERIKFHGTSEREECHDDL